MIWSEEMCWLFSFEKKIKCGQFMSCLWVLQSKQPVSNTCRKTYKSLYFFSLYPLFCDNRLERKTIRRKKIFATLKVLGTVVEELTEEMSPDSAEGLITEEVFSYLWWNFCMRWYSMIIWKRLQSKRIGLCINLCVICCYAQWDF